MNTLLDTTGALIFFVVSIVLLPVIFLAHCFIWMMISFKQARVLALHLRKLYRRRTPWHMPVQFDLQLIARRLFN